MLSQRCGRHALRLAARRWPPTWLIGACPCAAVSGRRVPAGSTTAPGSSLARTASVALRYASTSSASASTERKERQAPRAAATNRELQTTDLLIAYRALVAAGVVQQDPEQIRALIELRKLTRILQEYTPPAHLLGVLHDTSGKVAPKGQQTGDPSNSTDTDKQPAPASDDNIAALVRHLSEEEEVQELGTPRGLLLTGKPGTGKTFLVDLWLDHLPVRTKFRRHYHHLLLHIYRLIWLEAERRRIRAAERGVSPAAAAEMLAAGEAASSVKPDRGVGAVWERSESGGRTKGTGKSITDWARSFRGMPFRKANRDDPVPVSSLDGTTLNDDANKGMDVVKLAQLEKQEDITAGAGTTLPMHVAAELFLTHGHVLVLDELQLLDIASATLLRRILTSYWRLGGVVVATSNRVPEDLYANNVQRRSLVAFLGALKERCPVVEIGGRDWRIERWKEGWDKFALRGEKDGESQSTFFIRGKPDEDKEYSAHWTRLAAGRESAPTTVKVYNRNVAVPESFAPTEELPGVARFTFAQLCDQPLGAADYLTLAATFEVIVLDGIPALDLVQRNQARRLITLIDCLYESRCKVVLRSHVPLTKIFFAREGEEVARENERRSKMANGEVDPTLVDDAASIDLLQSAALIQSETLSEAAQDTEEGFRPNVLAYGPIVEDAERPEPGRASAQQRKDQQRQEGTNTGDSLRTLSIFSGEEERFAYQRAVSRLWEMSHSSWNETQWKPLVEAELGSWQQSAAQTVDRQKEIFDALRASTTAAAASTPRHETAAASDFADEASYNSVSKDERRRSSRAYNRDQGPPVLSDAHIWGVRDDWGPKAGRWGRGVRDLDIEDGQNDGDHGESPRERRARLREERLRSTGTP